MACCWKHITNRKNDLAISVIYCQKNGNGFLRLQYLADYIRKKWESRFMSLINCVCLEYRKIKANIWNNRSFLKNLLDDEWKEKEEEAFRKSRPKEEGLYSKWIALRFNYDRFLQGLSTSVFPQMARNDLRCIGELATIHGIDEMSMRKLVSQSMNLKDNTLNLEVLKERLEAFKGNGNRRKKTFINFHQFVSFKTCKEELQSAIQIRKLIESLFAWFSDAAGCCQCFDRICIRKDKSETYKNLM